MNVGLVFGIIFTIILIGFLFSVGIDQIISIFGVTGQAQIQGTVKNIERLVEELYHLSEGSSNTYTISIPAGSKICFLKPDDPTPNPARGWNPEPFIYTHLIADNQSQYFGSNLWIYFNPKRQEGYKIPYLEPIYNFCVTSGQELYFENRGVFVSVESI